MNTVGQRRPGYATVGIRTEIEVNAFAVTIDSKTVHQYDGMFMNDFVPLVLVNLTVDPFCDQSS